MAKKLTDKAKLKEARRAAEKYMALFSPNLKLLSTERNGEFVVFRFVDEDAPSVFVQLTKEELLDVVVIRRKVLRGATSLVELLRWSADELEKAIDKEEELR